MLQTQKEKVNALGKRHVKASCFVTSIQIVKFFVGRFQTTFVKIICLMFKFTFLPRSHSFCFFNSVCSIKSSNKKSKLTYKHEENDVFVYLPEGFVK